MEKLCNGTLHRELEMHTINEINADWNINLKLKFFIKIIF